MPTYRFDLYRTGAVRKYFIEATAVHIAADTPDDARAALDAMIEAGEDGDFDWEETDVEWRDCETGAASVNGGPEPGTDPSPVDAYDYIERTAAGGADYDNTDA